MYITISSSSAAAVAITTVAQHSDQSCAHATRKPVAMARMAGVTESICIRAREPLLMPCDDIFGSCTMVAVGSPWLASSALMFSAVSPVLMAFASASSRAWIFTLILRAAASRRRGAPDAWSCGAGNSAALLGFNRRSATFRIVLSTVSISAA